jgi:hypothetical protein
VLLYKSTAQCDSVQFTGVPPGATAVCACIVCHRGEDLFGLQQHLDNWLTTPTDYDILFVRWVGLNAACHILICHDMCDIESSVSGLSVACVTHD